jgi:hypothetical protein
VARLLCFSLCSGRAGDRRSSTSRFLTADSSLLFFFPSQAVDRIKKEIAKIKEKEKKAYGKMFG